LGVVEFVFIDILHKILETRRGILIKSNIADSVVPKAKIVRIKPKSILKFVNKSTVIRELPMIRKKNIFFKVSILELKSSEYFLFRCDASWNCQIIGIIINGINVKLKMNKGKKLVLELNKKFPKGNIKTENN
jgi:hypothetical protein